MTAMFQIGGPAGALCVGWVMDRWNKYRVLMAVFMLSGAVIYAIGQATGHFVLLCSIAWMVGFCLNGASVGMNALAATFYPAQARATGASWMSGIGRVGAILSAFAGAQMLSWGWTFAQCLPRLWYLPVWRPWRFMGWAAAPTGCLPIDRWCLCHRAGRICKHRYWRSAAPRP